MALRLPVFALGAIIKIIDEMHDNALWKDHKNSQDIMNILMIAGVILTLYVSYMHPPLCCMFGAVVFGVLLSPTEMQDSEGKQIPYYWLISAIVVISCLYHSKSAYGGNILFYIYIVLFFVFEDYLFPEDSSRTKLWFRGFAVAFMAYVLQHPEEVDRWVGAKNGVAGVDIETVMLLACWFLGYTIVSCWRMWQLLPFEKKIEN